MAKAIKSGLGNALGLGLAMATGVEQRKQNRAKDAALRAKLGLPPIEEDISPLEKGVNWVKGKASEVMGNMASSLPGAASGAASGAGVSAGVSAGDTVGLVDRLMAGNIDQAGSEANQRWGSGKALIDEAMASAPVTERSLRAPTEMDVVQNSPTPASEAMQAQDYASGYTLGSDPKAELVPFQSAQGPAQFDADLAMGRD